MNHIFTRSQALQPRVKKIILVQENSKKYLVIKKLFSSYLIGDFMSPTLDALDELHLPNNRYPDFAGDSWITNLDTHKQPAKTSLVRDVASKNMTTTITPTKKRKKKA
jgi:hypothetical protein